MRKILFASSEVFPLIKTGGLADVAGSLPPALCDLKQDVRLILPAFPDAIKAMAKTRCMARINMPQGEVKVLMGNLPGTQVKVWLVDYPPFFDRQGNPYTGPDNKPWHDNADRFALFCRIIVEIAMKRTSLKWRPDIVHCHDWQTGLVPALLSLEKNAPSTIFTIHNMAYQGLFPYSTFLALGLPQKLWSFKALEFHDQLSFIKGGLVFADQVTTVSPTYAKEIQTAEFAYGLEGLLQYRADNLSGILNGIDMDSWNPESDAYIAEQYSVRKVDAKKSNKKSLQDKFGLPEDPDIPLLGIVGRLVYQKGIDIVLQAIHELMKIPVQLIVLGSGEQEYEQALQKFFNQYPDNMGVYAGYNEELAHQIEAGVDIFLMPSRFEPCGLNQLYSLRYGTLPIVRPVGGLADTIVDATEQNLEAGTANGFVFTGDQGWDLVEAVQRALVLFSDKLRWKKLQLTAMWRDYSWDNSAQEYVRLYALTMKAHKTRKVRQKYDDHARLDVKQKVKKPDAG
ncbi:MAG: glycogen synthase GlgA [Gammaproteobacteria bacterium]|nr:glycogen synthase GlgA [Gammaproteobacteria bacterium]